MMVGSVSLHSDKLQVVKSVVRLDAVAMVDLLARSQASSQMRLHDETMFKAILATADVDSDVAAAEFVATASPVGVLVARLPSVLVGATLRAVFPLASLDGAGEGIELVSAFPASNSHRSPSHANRFAPIVA